MPDEAVGATAEAAVTLQTEALSPSQNLTLLSPCGEGPLCQQHQVPLQKCSRRAGTERWAAAVLGLFYIRIESTGNTILTDFLVGGSVIWRFSVDSTILLARLVWLR